MTSLPASLFPTIHLPVLNPIGCQELLAKDDVSHSGMLQKQLTHRKHSLFSLFFDKLPWVSRYVVLQNGCLYHYPNSQAKKPSGCYSLLGYHKVVRARDISIKRYPWAFRIVNMQQTKQLKYFAAPSEREMKVWIKAIKAELITANSELMSEKMSVSEDEDCEKSIYKDKKELIRAASRISKKGKAVVGDDDDDDDDDDEYIELDTSFLGKKAGTKQLGKKNLASGTGEIASMAGKNETKLPGSVPVVGKPLGDQNLINGISGISAKVGQEGARPPAPLPDITDEEDGEDYSDIDNSPPKRMPPEPSPQLRAQAQEKVDTTGFAHITDEEDGEDYSDIDNPSPKRMPPQPAPRLRAQPQPQAQENVDTTRFAPPSKPPRQKDKKESDKGSAKLITSEKAFWAGSDKGEADKIIDDIAKEGVFMIRDSEQWVKTMVCYADGKVIRYKIQQTDNSEYFIQERNHFPNITALLEYYTKNNLPNKSTPLTEIYTTYYNV